MLKYPLENNQQEQKIPKRKKLPLEVALVGVDSNDFGGGLSRTNVVLSI